MERYGARTILADENALSLSHLPPVTPSERLLVLTKGKWSSAQSIRCSKLCTSSSTTTTLWSEVSTTCSKVSSWPSRVFIGWGIVCPVCCSERWLVAFTNALCETRGGSWVCETGSCKAVACVVKFRWVNFFGLRTASPKKLTAAISALEKFRITKAARVVSERFLEWGICVKCSLILHCQTNYSRVENAYLVYSAGILSSLNQTEQCRHERALPRLMLIDIP